MGKRAVKAAPRKTSAISRELTVTGSSPFQLVLCTDAQVLIPGPQLHLTRAVLGAGRGNGVVDLVDVVDDAKARVATPQL